jgi:para-nitrobenzyl esterase
MAIVAIAAGMNFPASALPLTVKTGQGIVRGKTINDGKVNAFLGLPYAAPPVGELRWKAPQPPLRWKGERDATRFGAHCVQGIGFPDMIFQDAGASEDCLFLNVYAPAGANAKSKLPVMFWIHGGGYTSGSSSEPRHNGDFLPLKGVVLVTINYRLGVFGFLATHELAQEAGGTAGNYGLMDMVAALQWVRANIGHFGGDAENVTIFGESAGSFAVSTLMASPLAKGFFQKAIGESGGAFDGAPLTGSLERAMKPGEALMASLGVNSLEALRALPAAKILDAARGKHINGIPPYVDGRVLTELLETAYAAGRQAHLPLLAGWNRDENSAMAIGMTMEKWKAFAVVKFHDRAEEFLKLYPGATDAEAQRSAADYGADNFIAFGTWKWIEAHRKTGDSPVYRYHFELAAPPSKFHAGSFAFHSDDIEYVFGTLETRPESEWCPEDRKLSEQMMSYWTNFARTGDPNGPGLSLWPRYSKDDAVLHLDSTITVAPDKLRARYEFLSK